MFKNFKLKYSHLVITIFITLNIIFLALIASNPFFASKSSVNLHAAPNCEASGNTSYFASVAFVIKSTNSSVPLPNSLGMSLKTSTCTNGWDNGIIWEPNYNISHQDALVKSGNITPGSYIDATQILDYHKTTGRAPSTYQVFPDYSVGGNVSNSTLFKCGSSQGCSLLNGRVVRSVNSNGSSVTIEYIQILDCAFSPEQYSLLGLPSGWTQSNGSSTLNLSNSSAIPTYTITVTPPAPPTPKLPVLAASLSCNGLSWNVSNFVSGDKLNGVIKNVSAAVVSAIPTQTNASGNVNTFVSALALEKSNAYYFAYVSLTYGNRQSINVQTNVLNFYNCISHPTPTPTPKLPVLTARLSCNGLSWNVSNFASGDKLNGVVETVSRSIVSTVASIPTQTNASGNVNTFVSALEKTNAYYYVYVGLAYGNGQSTHAQTSSVDFYNCISHPTPPNTPVLTASLSCNGLSWNVSNFASGDKLNGVVETVSRSIVSTVASIPTQTTASGNVSTFVSTLEGSNAYYYVYVGLAYGNGQNIPAQTSSVDFYNCISHPTPTPPTPTPPTPTIAASMGCNGITWSTTNFASGDSITGNITDTTTNTVTTTLPTQTIASGTYNSFVQSLEDTQDNYTATLTLSYSGGSTTVSSGNVNFYQCVNHTTAPILNTVTLSCVTGSSNLTIGWTSQDSSSTDTFYGTINDTTSNTNAVATFTAPVSQLSYVWNGANSTDQYVIVGYINGTSGQSNSITSSSASVSQCITPQVPVMSSISFVCENNTTNNLTIQWQASNVVNTDNFTGYITDTTTGNVVYNLPNTPAQLGEYIWQGANGVDKYTVTGWLQNASGQKFNVTTSIAVSSSCITSVPLAPVVVAQQQLPQTAGTAPISIFVLAGLIILSIGVSVMVF